MEQAFEPKDSNWRARVREIFGGQGFMELLGVTLDDVEPGHVRMSVPFRPELTQQNGFFHGGLMATLVDNSGGVAAGTLMAAGQDVLMTEFKINALRPGAGDRLSVVTNLVRAGRTLAVTRMDVFAHAGDSKKLCAVGQGTYMYVPRAGDR